MKGSFRLDVVPHGAILQFFTACVIFTTT